MQHSFARLLGGLALVALLIGFTGCDVFESILGENEISGTVEQVGDDFLVVDATTYAVTDATEFEGFSGLDDIAVGDRVDIEWEDRSGERVALEIEDPTAPDPD